MIVYISINVDFSCSMTLKKKQFNLVIYFWIRDMYKNEDQAIYSFVLNL